MKLSPIAHSIRQLIMMIVLTFILGALILLGISYFDDRPREASVFFLGIGCFAVLNRGRKRWKSRKENAKESIADHPEE